MRIVDGEQEAAVAHRQQRCHQAPPADKCLHINSTTVSGSRALRRLGLGGVVSCRRVVRVQE